MRLQSLFLSTFLSLISCNIVLAGGFEKTISWSARNAAIGGAAASSVEGADALYFNPAGLAEGKATHEISANLTPTFSRFEGPIVESYRKERGSVTIKPPFALLGQYKFERIGIGTGIYSAGGTSALFQGVDYSAQNPNFLRIMPDLQSSLSIVEYSIGLGFKISQNLNIGLAWRATAINADLKSVTTSDLSGQGGTPDIMVTSHIKEVKDTTWEAYRLGIQYLSDNKDWGLGVMYRSPVRFQAHGTVQGKVIPAAFPESDIEESNVIIKNEFPQQVELAGHFTVVPATKLFLGYSWTNYAQNKNLEIEGRIRYNLGGSMQESSLPSIKQDWYNQHSVRFGVEDNHLPNWALRFAYINTSQVTNENAARATFSSPGHAHTFVAGTGTSLMNKSLDLDFAGEYSVGKGRGKTTDAPTIHGTFQSKAVALYTSIKYRF